MACRLYRGKTGLDALPYHQQTGRGTEPHDTAAAWPEHHLRRIDRRFAAAVAGEKRAVNADRLAVSAVRHQSHHPRPQAAPSMFQPGMEADRRRYRDREPARAQIIPPAFRSDSLAIPFSKLS